MKLHEAIKEKRREADILSEAQRVFPDAFLRHDGKIVAPSATSQVNGSEFDGKVLWFMASNAGRWPSLPADFSVYAFGLRVEPFGKMVAMMAPGDPRTAAFAFLKTAADFCDDDIAF